MLGRAEDAKYTIDDLMSDLTAELETAQE